MKAAPTHFAALHWFQSMGELDDPLQPLHELLRKQEHGGVIRSPSTARVGSVSDAQRQENFLRLNFVLCDA